ALEDAVFARVPAAAFVATFNASFPSNCQIAATDQRRTFRQLRAQPKQSRLFSSSPSLRPFCTPQMGNSRKRAAWTCLSLCFLFSFLTYESFRWCITIHHRGAKAKCAKVAPNRSLPRCAARFVIFA